MAASVPPSAGAENVPVFLLDGTQLSFPITKETTFAALDEMVYEKLDLGPTVKTCFRTFHIQAGYERQPTDKEIVMETFHSFEEDAKRFKKKGKKLYKFIGESKFIFKKCIFSRRRELDLVNTPELTLLYMQAQFDIVQSNVPSHGPDAVELAGISMQVDYGDYDESQRSVGFLSKNNVLHKYVPSRSLAMKLHSNAEWETVIFQHYAEQRGRTKEESMRHYLNFARKSVFYGARMFVPSKVHHKGEHLSETRIQVAVCSTVMILVDPKSWKSLWQFPFSNIQGWGKTADALSFFVEIKGKGDGDKVRFVVNTPQAQYMFECMNSATKEATDDAVAREKEALAVMNTLVHSHHTPHKDELQLSQMAASKWMTKLHSPKTPGSPASPLAGGGAAVFPSARSAAVAAPAGAPAGTPLSPGDLARSPADTPSPGTRRVLKKKLVRRKKVREDGDPNTTMSPGGPAPL